MCSYLAEIVQLIYFQVATSKGKTKRNLPADLIVGHCRHVYHHKPNPTLEISAHFVLYCLICSACTKVWLCETIACSIPILGQPSCSFASHDLRWDYMAGGQLECGVVVVIMNASLQFSSGNLACITLIVVS